MEQGQATNQINEVTNQVVNQTNDNVVNQDRVYFFDTTLRDGEQSPGVSLQTPEKIEISQNLVRLGIDVIEAGFPAASPGDFEAVKKIADEVRGITICGLARANKADIERTAEALKGAAHSRLHVFIATSDIHLEYKLKKTRAEVIEIVKDCLAFAAGKFDEIEFSAEDASRTDLDYLCEVFAVAIEGVILRKDTYQDCLVLYPENVWNEQMNELRCKLNRWNSRHQMIFRQFVSDVEVITLDGNGRFLIPKRYLKLAKIQQDVRFIGLDDTIEIWSKEIADKPFITPEDFGKELEEIMGTNNNVEIE